MKFIKIFIAEVAEKRRKEQKHSAGGVVGDDER
jgi:hypothetical protein